MPQTFIAVEIPAASDTRIIHQISVPLPSEQGFYRQVTSLNSFTSGRRAALTPRERAYSRVTPAWAPGRLYIVHHVGDWEREVGGRTDYMRKHGHEWADEREMPRVRHESIWAFYAYIGWDRHRRRYVDSEGRPIRYSAA